MKKEEEKRGEKQKRMLKDKWERERENDEFKCIKFVCIILYSVTMKCTMLLSNVDNEVSDLSHMSSDVMVKG